jgi:hypothetical protein
MSLITHVFDPPDSILRLTQHTQALHSYVDTISSQPGSPREHTREQLSQPFLELGTWLDHVPHATPPPPGKDLQTYLSPGRAIRRRW